MIFPHFGPGSLRWARERFGLAQEDFAGKFNPLPEWEEDEARVILKQVEAFARTACARVRYNVTSIQDQHVGLVRPVRKRPRRSERWRPIQGSAEVACRAATVRHLDRERRKVRMR